MALLKICSLDLMKKPWGVLSAANRIVNPKFLPVGNSAIASYGKTELEKVIDWLGPNDNSKGFVNPSVMRNEYLSFKMILKNYKGKPLSDVCSIIVNEYSDLFGDFSVVAKVLLISPLTSVACERGFSSQNRLKTKSGCRLAHEKVAKLIRIVEEGPPVSLFDASSVLNTFENMKSRRK